MNLEELVAEFSHRFNLPGLKLNEEGVARLVFDKRLVVDIESPRDSDKFFIIGIISVLPPSGRESLYAKLLEADSFGKTTGGGVLGIDPVASEIILTRSFPNTNIDFEQFSAELEKFLTAMEHWQHEVSKPDVPPDEKGGESVSQFHMRA